MIVKIAVKRGIQNTNNKIMAEELKVSTFFAHYVCVLNNLFHCINLFLLRIPVHYRVSGLEISYYECFHLYIPGNIGVNILIHSFVILTLLHILFV